MTSSGDDHQRAETSVSFEFKTYKVLQYAHIMMRQNLTYSTKFVRNALLLLRYWSSMDLGASKSLRDVFIVSYINLWLYLRMFFTNGHHDLHLLQAHLERWGWIVILFGCPYSSCLAIVREVIPLIYSNSPEGAVLRFIPKSFSFALTKDAAMA